MELLSFISLFLTLIVTEVMLRDGGEKGQEVVFTVKEGDVHFFKVADGEEWERKLSRKLVKNVEDADLQIANECGCKS